MRCCSLFGLCLPLFGYPSLIPEHLRFCKYRPNICIMATRRVEIGPTGEAVRANVARVRKQQGMTLRDVSDRLAQIGHPMAHNTVSEIERGARRVDVDDLITLALVLGVSPATLLMPAVHSVKPQDRVESTGVVDPVPAEALWVWLTAKFPLSKMSFLSFAERSWPSWERENYTAQMAQNTAQLTGVSKTLSGRVPRGINLSSPGGEEVSSGDD